MSYLQLEPMPITDIWEAVDQKVTLNIIPRNQDEPGMLKTDQIRKITGTLQFVDERRSDQGKIDRTIFGFGPTYVVVVDDLYDYYEIWKQTPVPRNRKPQNSSERV